MQVKIPLTKDTARAIAADAANARMRHSGRTAWNAADYRLAVKTLNGLLDRLSEPADYATTKEERV